MENRSTSQLQAEQTVLTKIEREIKKILPKLQEFENILKVEELQIKSNVLSATLGNPEQTKREVGTTIVAPDSSSTTAFDLAKDTSVREVEDEFEVNQQDIMLDMVFKSVEEEEEDDDEEFISL